MMKRANSLNTPIAPLVSFIIPAKNEGLRLPRCLSAINTLEVDCGRVEVIVIDNGSHDNTVEIANKYGAITYSLPKATISSLRNFGAQISKGEYLAFIDADVEVKPGFIKNAMPYFDNHRVGIVTGLILVPDDATWVERTWYLSRTKTILSSELKWSSSMNMIVRRAAFFEAGGFTAEMITCEDVDFCQKLSKLNYQIFYDWSVQVVHFGEAKDLKQFYKKEKWRGYNAWSLVTANIRDAHILMSFLQAPVFMLSFLIAIVLLLLSHCETSFVFFIVAFALPFYRTISVVLKKKAFNHIHQLFALWVVYYFARAMALLKV